jgi:hypothetical protein
MAEQKGYKRFIRYNQVRAMSHRIPTDPAPASRTTGAGRAAAPTATDGVAGAAKGKAAPAAPPAARAATAKGAAAAAKVAAAAAAAKHSATGRATKKLPKLRPQLVRDSFAMPEADFAVIATLKARALGARRAAKKSELLRAGLRTLAELDAKALVAALDKLEPVKTGRPKKGH